jgi:hypothetical protein
VNSETSLSDAELFDAFMKNGIPKDDATEILLFLPIAFVRQMLPGLQWLRGYTEIDGHKNQVQKRYADSGVYQIIFSIAEKYIQTSPGTDNIIKLAGRSAEFHAIITLLLDNPNTKLDEIKLTETFIVR